MHDEGMQVSPHLVKENLRTLLGGFISKHRLGQYLDFNVVVIPTGKHVTEFPTADAAFHPFQQKDDKSSDAQLEIRIVPWLIVKMSANESLSRKLHKESHNFWKAGVEEMWEICMWNRLILVHTAEGKIREIKGDSRIMNDEVLPGFAGTPDEIFHRGAESSLIPEAHKEDSWLIDQSLRTGERKLKKAKTPDFVMASPEQLQAATALQDQENAIPSGGSARVMFDMIVHSWPGRLLLILLVSILGTMIVLMIAESSGDKTAPEYDPAKRKQPIMPADGIKRELARSTVIAYFKKSDIDGRLSLVRHQEHVTPLMEDYYSSHPLRPQTVRLFGDIEDVELDGSRFLKLPTWLDNGSHDVFLEDEGKNGYRIDWDSLVGYNSIDFADFVSTKDSTREFSFRILASDSGFHGGRFDNVEKFMSVVLNFPNTDKRLYGYVRLKSPIAPTVKKLVNDQYKRPLRLRLRWPSESDFANDPITNDSLITDSDREMTAQLKGRQVWITAIEGDSWLKLNP